MVIDPKVLEAAKAQHGPDALRLVRTGGREFLVRRPERGEYKRFRREAASDRTRDDAVETLVLDCIVFPSREDFSKLLETYPALCEEISEPVLELAGLTGKASTGKV